MSRMELFKTLESDAWFHRLWKRLKPAEIAICEEFIRSHDHLGIGAFEMAVNRMFIDKAKPKNYPIILELLTITNSKLSNLNKAALGGR